MSEELLPPPRALGTTFKRPTSLLVLGDPNGAHIVLDASQNAIQLWDGTTIVGEWRAPDNQFDVAFRLAVAGDTDARFIIRGDGAHLWGPGNAGQDIVLFRNGVGQLELQGSLLVDASVGINGPLTTDDVFIGGDTQAGLITANAVSINSGLTLAFGSSVESPVGVPAKFMTGVDQGNCAGGLAFPNSAAALTPTLIPGCSITLDVNQVVNYVEIRPDIWCRNTNFGAGVATVVQLYVDGVPDAISMVSQTTAANGRAEMGRNYEYTNMAVGTHTFELYANLSAIPGVTGYSVEADRTTIAGKVFE